MAGDHKCPVCQSTFTRPQHVARHMRSHTGDRPYKCQHCGDQFARSDLLSRHINKCHASEKPPTTTAPSRRKGTAAASRATTSKQACDQCVTSSLPCDGANPCSKCVQRKCRCTYVKFHRQTAPSGPGHALPPSGSAASHGRHAISLGAPRLPDDFFLAPPPGTMPVSSMYAPTAHQYPMAHTSAVYPHDYTSLPPLASALAPSESSMSAMMQPHHREIMDSPDAMARIRAQAEMLTRAGVISNGSLTLAQPTPTADTSAAIPGLYAAAAGAQDSRYDRYNLPPPSQWDAPRQFQQAKDFEAPYGQRSQSQSTIQSFSAAGAAGGEPTLQTHPPTTTNSSSSYDGGSAGPASIYQHANLPPASSLYAQQHMSHPHHQHARSDDLSSSKDDFGSDAGSSSTGLSHSIPNSANSSAVHLPLPGFNNLRTRSELGKEDFEQNYQAGAQGQNRDVHEGEGGFSSAFGLMSLDDPNVLAGLSNDGQPFFSSLNPFATDSNSSGNMSNAPGGLSLGTPTQDLIAQLKSAGGREGMDSKELRDFWKMYLRTPLTGPNSSGSGIMFPLQTPTGPGAPLDQHMGQVGTGRPSPARRHSRVSSLPSMKTPPLFAEEQLGSSYARPSTGDQYDSHGNQSRDAGYRSNVRTTAHDAEDLKSYEQAVLARRAPMNLNLVPKRKGSVISHAPADDPRNLVMSKSTSTSPIVPHAGFASSNASGGSKIAELLNRPPSTSSVGTTGSSGSGVSLPSNTSTTNTTASQGSSSLAHAFGGDQSGSRDGQCQSHSQTTDGQATYAGGLAPPMYRPSFKRIASQTLGPEHSKRALLGPAGWDHQEEEGEEGDDAVVEEEEEEEEEGEEDRGMALGASSALGGGEGQRRMNLSAQAQS